MISKLIIPNADFSSQSFDSGDMKLIYDNTYNFDPAIMLDYWRPAAPAGEGYKLVIMSQSKGK